MPTYDNPVARALDLAEKHNSRSDIKGFGRILCRQITERSQAAQAADVEAPAIILSDFEVGALLYFLAHGRPIFTGAVWLGDGGQLCGSEMKASDPWTYARIAGAIGILRVGPVDVYTESKAVQAVRAMVAAESKPGTPAGAKTRGDCARSETN